MAQYRPVNHNCVVEYAGYDTANAIVARSLLIENCEIRHNNARGIHSLGTEIAPSLITNNIVTDNTRGGIYAQFSIVTNNIVSHNGRKHWGIYNGGGIDIIDSIATNNTVDSNYAADIGGGISASRSTIRDNIITNNICDLRGGGVSAGDSVVSGNIVIGNSGVYGGGIHVNTSTAIDNVIVDNLAAQGGGMWVNGAAIRGNLIRGNLAYTGGGIYVKSSAVVSNTIVSNNLASESSFPYGYGGAGVYLYSISEDFAYNIVANNRALEDSTAGGLEFIGDPQIHYNYFYGNTPYDVRVQSSSNISGTNNYWGTVDTANILAQIYDWYDDDSLGRFLYIPYLQEPSPDAPVPPPTELVVRTRNDGVTLSWNALPSFTTGWGYKVYYDTDNSIPPFVGTGLNEGDAPIDVEASTSYTLTGLDPNTDYYFAVTAYDNLGREGWYSNVARKLGGYWVYLPLVIRE